MPLPQYTPPMIVVGKIAEPNPSIIRPAVDVKYAIDVVLPGMVHSERFTDQVPSVDRPVNVDIVSYSAGQIVIGTYRNEVINWFFQELEAGEDCPPGGDAPSGGEQPAPPVLGDVQFTSRPRTLFQRLRDTVGVLFGGNE